jgi:hypothetical protein
MDAIKKKMQSLKSETENALARAAQLDAEAKDSTKRAEKTEEHVRKILILFSYTLGTNWMLFY